MTDFGLEKDDLEIIKRVIQVYPDIEQALIFGSRAMGSYKRGSDIDIALKGNLNSDTMSQIKHMLNQGTFLPYFFDVLDYHSISNPNLKDHIDEHGKVFYEAKVAEHQI